MKIAEIGKIFRNTVKVPFLSNQTFIEFDAIIISFPNLLAGFNTKSIDFFHKRKESLKEFLMHKNVPLIFFTPAPQKFEFNNNDIYFAVFYPVLRRARE